MGKNFQKLSERKKKKSPQKCRRKLAYEDINKYILFTEVKPLIRWADVATYHNLFSWWKKKPARIIFKAKISIWVKTDPGACMILRQHCFFFFFFLGGGGGAGMVRAAHSCNMYEAGRTRILNGRNKRVHFTVMDPRTSRTCPSCHRESEERRSSWSRFPWRSRGSCAWRQSLSTFARCSLV